jgi:ABC-type nitrate/sulfonate/bicarbonate transport system ATPase subunit
MLDSLTRYELQEVLISLWRRERITAMMVTHDVDEALFLSDRIICMTDGPAAGIGEIIAVDFPRPRFRKEVMEHPDYYKLRAQLIEFLEVRAHQRPGRVPAEDDIATTRSTEPQPAIVGT